MDITKNFAILIDGDNSQASSFEHILEEVGKYGRVLIKRVYGNWDSAQMNAWKEKLKEYPIKPIQNYPSPTGKNATDIVLVIDAMDLLHSEKIDGICIVSNDSDFTPLANRVRETGVFLIGMGTKDTPKTFLHACDVFHFVEDFSGKSTEKQEVKIETIEEKQTPLSENIPTEEVKEEIQSTEVIAEKETEVPVYQSIEFSEKENVNTLVTSKKEDSFLSEEKLELLKQAVSSKMRNGVALLSQVTEEIQRLDKSFRPKTYGYASFSKLFVGLSDYFVVFPQKDQTTLLVRLKTEEDNQVVENQIVEDASVKEEIVQESSSEKGKALLEILDFINKEKHIPQEIQQKNEEITIVEEEQPLEEKNVFQEEETTPVKEEKVSEIIDNQPEKETASQEKTPSSSSGNKAPIPKHFPPMSFLKKVYSQAPKENGVVLLGIFGKELRKIDPSFDAKNYGHSSVSKMLKYLGHTFDLIMSPDGKNIVAVRMKTNNEKPAKERAPQPEARKEDRYFENQQDIVKQERVRDFRNSRHFDRQIAYFNQAINSVKNEKNEALLSRVMETLRKINRDFQPKSYGYNNIREMLTDLPDYYEIIKHSDGTTISVKIKEVKKELEKNKEEGFLSRIIGYFQ